MFLCKLHLTNLQSALPSQAVRLPNHRQHLAILHRQSTLWRCRYNFFKQVLTSTTSVKNWKLQSVGAWLSKIERMIQHSISYDRPMRQIIKYTDKFLSPDATCLLYPHYAHHANFTICKTNRAFHCKGEHKGAPLQCSAYDCLFFKTFSATEFGTGE